MESQGKEKFAYYCRMGAVTAGVNALGTVPKTSEPIVTEFVETLLDRVEKDAAKYGINASEEADNLRELQTFGLDLFNRSFKEDARRAVNKNTILRYRNAAILLEVVTLLAREEDNVLLPKVNEISIWAKSRISYMLKEIKAGRAPEPPQQAEVDDLELGDAFAAFMNASSSQDSGSQAHDSLSARGSLSVTPTSVQASNALSARTNSNPVSARDPEPGFQLPEVPSFNPIPNVQFGQPSVQSPMDTAGQENQKQIPNLLNSPNAPGPMDNNTSSHETKKADTAGEAYHHPYSRVNHEPPSFEPMKPMTNQVKNFSSSFKEEEAKFNDASEFTRFALAAMREKNGSRAIEFLNQAVQRLMR